MDTLDPVHGRAARLIHQQRHTLRRRHLLVMHDVFQDNVSHSFKSLFKVEMQRRSSLKGNQVEIPRVMHEVGKESVQYTGILRRFSKDILNKFSLKDTMVAKKSDDFIYS